MTAPQRVFLEPYSDFTAASRAALDLLQDRLGMGLWMVTRVAGDEQIVLGAVQRGSGYPIQEGDAFRWSDTFCARMVAEEAPQCAPCVAEVAAYRAAPAARGMAIAAYVGIPLRTAGGELFGTLCAIDPLPHPELERGADALLTVVGRLLATVLERDLRLAAEARRSEQAEAAAMLDELTGLWNRRAWDRFRDTEEARCRRYGHSACVLSVDLDGLKATNDQRGHQAGDELLRRAAGALKRSVREQDVVARVGGDEFAVLLVECQEEQGRVVEQRLRAELARDQVAASVGFARREPATGLGQAWARADEQMYCEKRAHKARAG
jgi:diguanylate cyclase (GGDEF)-like protein